MSAAEPSATPQPPIPVTIIGGYLGAGKTTLVNHVLRHAGGLRLAVLVNDFGDLPIDADLIESRAGNVVGIAGGCICCSYGSDLMAALMDMAMREPAPDHVIIETSGVALPGPVAAALTLLARYARDGIIVLADAETISSQARDRYLADTIRRQLAEADLVLINKADLVSPVVLEAARSLIRDTAPQARLLIAERARVPLDVLIGAGLERVRDPGDFRLDRHHPGCYEALVLELPGPVDPVAIAAALSATSLGLLRAKGFVRDTEGRRWSIQVVGARAEVQAAVAPESSIGRIVCIGLAGAIDRGRLADLT